MSDPNQKPMPTKEGESKAYTGYYTPTDEEVGVYNTPQESQQEKPPIEMTEDLYGEEWRNQPGKKDGSTKWDDFCENYETAYARQYNLCTKDIQLDHSSSDVYNYRDTKISDRLKDAQNSENSLAEAQGRDPQNISDNPEIKRSIEEDVDKEIEYNSSLIAAKIALGENSDESIELGKALEKDQFENELNDALIASESEMFQILVRGALLFCPYGTHPRKLNIPIGHGVYEQGRDVAFRTDAVPIENIEAFGICNSPTPPENTEEVRLTPYTSVDDQGNYLSKPDTETTFTGCACKPSIVGNIWNDTFEQYKLAENNGAISSTEIHAVNTFEKRNVATTKSYLICNCGPAVIRPLTSGQDEINITSGMSLQNCVDFPPLDEEGNFSQEKYDRLLEWCERNDVAPYAPGTPEYFDYYSDQYSNLEEELTNVKSPPLNSATEEEFYEWGRELQMVKKDTSEKSEKLYNQILSDMLKKYGIYENIPQSEKDSMTTIKSQYDTLTRNSTTHSIPEDIDKYRTQYGGNAENQGLTNPDQVYNFDKEIAEEQKQNQEDRIDTLIPNYPNQPNYDDSLMPY